MRSPRCRQRPPLAHLAAQRPLNPKKLSVSARHHCPFWLCSARFRVLLVSQDVLDLARWPASLAGADQSRWYASGRQSSRAWVDGLTTRSGTPRWHRISRCGDPVAVWSASGGLAWQHRWCRDRACVACCHSRCRQQSQALRAELSRRTDAPLFFVTLTRPRRRGEPVDAAWSGWMRAWTALRHRPEWSAVAGAVRVLEAVHSHRKGWHVHAHCIFEMQASCTKEMVACRACRGTGRRWNAGAQAQQRCRTCTPRNGGGTPGYLPADLDAVLQAWERLVGGLPQAQCAVPLEMENAGQLCKYISKLFELPAAQARELFAAVASRRIIDGCGTWRGWRKRADEVESTPAHWYSSEVALRDLETRPLAELVPFVARVPGVLLEAQRTVNGRVVKRDAWRPYAVVHRVTVGELLHHFTKDKRAAWQRDDVEAGPRDRLVREQLRELAREHWRGYAHYAHRDGPPGPTPHFPRAPCYA